MEIALKANPTLTVKRAKFAAVTRVDVMNAYNNLI
jgi:hypothetical protein